MLQVSDFSVERYFIALKVSAVMYFMLQVCRFCKVDLRYDLVLIYVAFLSYVYNRTLFATSIGKV